MELVYAKGTGWVGPTVQLLEGEAWLADDPLVLARPELFTDRPKVIRTTLSQAEIAARQEAPVEQATRAPGERRATRKPRKSAESPPEDTGTEGAPEGESGDE